MNRVVMRFKNGGDDLTVDTNDQLFWWWCWKHWRPKLNIFAGGYYVVKTRMNGRLAGIAKIDRDTIKVILWQIGVDRET